MIINIIINNNNNNTRQQAAAEPEKWTHQLRLIDQGNLSGFYT